MAGGLTLGAGALLGSVAGALGFAGAAWGFNSTTDRERTTVQFTDDFLRTFLVASVLRYLTVAHFGRGRGNFAQGEAPAFWQTEVERAVAVEEAAVARLWPALRLQPDAEKSAIAAQAVVARITSSVLRQLYPVASSAHNA